MIFRNKKFQHLIGYLKHAKIFSTSSQKNYKVTVLGAAGGIGQPLTMLLKQNPLVTALAAYDVHKITPGVAVDVSHINTRSIADGFEGKDQLANALCGSNVIVCTASGIACQPGMNRDDVFKTNADIVYDLACAIANHAPCAILAIVTNPVNSTLPIVSEVMMRCGVYDPCKIFGVTTLDLVRASTFVTHLNCADPSTQYVPVIGGHDGATIIPLLSQSNPPVFLVGDIRDQLTKRIQEAGTEIVKSVAVRCGAVRLVELNLNATGFIPGWDHSDFSRYEGALLDQLIAPVVKAGGGSATVSMAFAAARFTDSILRGLAGEQNVIECSYVRSDVTQAKYFSTPVVLGQCGMEKILGTGPVNTYEKGLIKKALPILIKNIQTGENFVKEKCKQ